MTEKKEVLPEAPASVNFRGVTQNGWNVQFTLRDVDEDTLLARFGHLINKLEENFKVVPEGKRPNGNGGSQNTVPQPTGEPQPREISFDAEYMDATVTAGKKPLWKVKGGKFMEWGVTIWPEVLEAAGLGEQDTSQLISLVGYTAYCNEFNDKGNPKKVARLVQQ